MMKRILEMEHRFSREKQPKHAVFKVFKTKKSMRELHGFKKRAPQNREALTLILRSSTNKNISFLRSLLSTSQE